MKVAYFSNTDFSLYNFRLGLMKKMKEKGYTVYACASENRHSEKLKEEFHFKNFPLKRSVDLLGRDLLYFYRVYSFCRKEKPFLCHNFTIKPCIYATLAQRMAGVEQIYCTITGVGYSFEKKGLLQKVVVFLYKRALKRTNKVIFQNPDDRQLFIDLGIVKEGELIKSSGVDTEKFSQIKEEKEDVTVTLISRMLYTKGVREFVEAAKEIKGAKFLLVGPMDKENPEAVTEKQMEEWKKYVQYLGETENTKEILSKTDIFVLPSYYREGVPKVLLEAGAMGLPLITTNTSGCRETVDDAVNGFLIKPKKKKELIKKLNILINDKDLRRRMGQASREKVEKEFDEKMVVEKTIKCYHLEHEER